MNDRFQQPFARKISRQMLQQIHTDAAGALDPQDPIYRQFIPNPLEQRTVDNFVVDPFHEQQYNPIPGLFHKYRQRVLLTVSTECAVHCRFCFRRWMTIQTPDWPRVLTYIQQHPQIQEVVLSGGDPLMLTAPAARAVMDQLATLPQLQRVRIHSRVPIVWPEKSYDFPWQATSYQHLAKILVVHCNHPSELTPASAAVLQQLHNQYKIALFSQTVLLKGVNDRPRVLRQLFEQLWQLQVQPYYLHLLDRVQGAAHFETSRLRTQRIYRMLQHYLPGFLIPKLVREQQHGKRYIGNIAL